MSDEIDAAEVYRKTMTASPHVPPASSPDRSPTLKCDHCGIVVTPYIGNIQVGEICLHCHVGAFRLRPAALSLPTPPKPDPYCSGCGLLWDWIERNEGEHGRGCTVSQPTPDTPTLRTLRRVQQEPALIADEASKYRADMLEHAEQVMAQLDQRKDFVASGILSIVADEVRTLAASLAEAHERESHDVEVLDRTRQGWADARAQLREAECQRDDARQAADSNMELFLKVRRERDDALARLGEKAAEITAR